MSKRPFSKKIATGQSVQAAFDYFISKDAHTGCWLWTGPAFNLRGGYGCFTMRPAGIVQQRAHRVSWELRHGPLPRGAHVLHRCDTPKCVNPDHLFLGTQQENMADKVVKGRQPRGETHSGCKLDEAAAMAIRNDDRLYKEIAADYGVSVPTISDIKRAHSWSHLGPPVNRYRRVASTCMKS